MIAVSPTAGVDGDIGGTSRTGGRGGTGAGGAGTGALDGAASAGAASRVGALGGAVPDVTSATSAPGTGPAPVLSTTNHGIFAACAVSNTVGLWGLDSTTAARGAGSTFPARSTA